MTDKDEVASPVVYSSSGEDTEIIINNESIWATKESISTIFDIDHSSVISHLANVFSSGELDENDNTQKIHTTKSQHSTQHYSLDAVISVGYRIDSIKATQFRLWATNILKQYVKDGFVINEELLRSDPGKLNKLAAKLRELRANEKNVYASVRECFRLAASDYKPSSSEVKKFYILLQDKFHHAITLMTSSKLVLDRADHTEINMGLQTIKGDIPTKEEITVGKNYLKEDEIYRMHLLSEQFLLYAETTALMNKSMTMFSLHEQLDNLLRLNGYPVFEGYKDYLKDHAMKHAEKEYEEFIEIKKLEHLGIDVDIEQFYNGEYDSYKVQTSQIILRDLKKQLALKT